VQNLVCISTGGPPVNLGAKPVRLLSRL